MKVKISIDNVGFGEKPSDKKDIIKTKYRTANGWKEMELEELADLNGNKGYTIIPAHLVGGIKSENCTEMQIYALDFDEGCTFKTVKKKCDNIGLKITYAYHTFSSSAEKEKFRIIFVLEQPEQNKFIINVISQMLIKIFPECDTSCQNMDRMFFGGKELVYFDNQVRFALVHLYFPFLKSLDIGTYFKENVKRFAQKTNILIINDTLCMGKIENEEVICGKKLESTVKHITADTKNYPFFIVERGLHQSITCTREQKRVDIQNRITRQMCGILTERCWAWYLTVTRWCRIRMRSALRMNCLEKASAMKQPDHCRRGRKSGCLQDREVYGATPFHFGRRRADVPGHPETR